MLNRDHLSGVPSPTERDDIFYGLLAGEGKAVLLRSIVQLGLPALLASKGPLTYDQIISELALHPHRGRKWLLLLQYADLIVETPLTSHDHKARYTNSSFVKALFDEDGKGGPFYKDFMRFWQKATSYNMVDLLRGLPIEQSVPYPPRTLEETEALHAWMRDTARETLTTIKKHFDFSKVSTLLDVGGGDATMATQLVKDFPNVHATVFNLPAAAYLARQTVAKAGVTGRVSVIDGDFFNDDLPFGYNVVMFSRVLADWPKDTCRMLLKKAHRSIDPGGTLLICEPLTDQNPALTIAFEQSQLPYDDFGYQLYKPLHIYEQLLQETGFAIAAVHNRDADSVHSVIIAHRL